jgi:hypothetical protein
MEVEGIAPSMPGWEASHGNDGALPANSGANRKFLLAIALVLRCASTSAPMPGFFIP